MTKIRIFLCLALTFGTLSITQAQGNKEAEAAYKAAKGDFYYGNYDKAMAGVRKAYTLDPENGEYAYLLGKTYMKVGQSPDQAFKLLLFAESKNLDPQVKNPYLFDDELGHLFSEDLNFLLGRAAHLHHEFDIAIDQYRTYLANLNPKKRAYSDTKIIVDNYIQGCLNGKELIGDTAEVTIVNLGTILNSEFPEYTPVISADETTLIFTSRRPNTTGGGRDPQNEEMYLEDIYISEKEDSTWSEPKKISTNINTPEHDAAIGISPDGSRLFLYRSNNYGTGDIWTSELEGNTWSVPKQLEGINSKHLEPSVSISADEQVIFFSSNRPGGYGGLDIYMARLLPNSKWADPIHLGPEVNTPFDDDSPFIHPDGKTLYFSSVGHNSMGGYDIFKAVYDEESNTWEQAKNLGYPINTAKDDIFFVWSADAKRGYFASQREDSRGLQDLYMLTRPKEKVSLIVLKGKVYSNPGKTPVSATITVTDNETGDIVGIYNSNSYTGKYTIIIPPGKNYGISVRARGYLPKSENIDLPDLGEYYEKENDIILDPLVAGSVTALRNVFFDVGKAELRPESFSELDHFYDILVENPTLYVEIAGHTDNVGSDPANLALSKNRSKSVVDYLIKKGIQKKRLYPVGYGEQFPVADNDTEEGRQLNRRTELIIVDILEGDAARRLGHYYESRDE